MKNAINYYYGLISDDIHKKDNQYNFAIGKTNYVLLPFFGDLKQLTYIYSYLVNNRFYCNEIILNKENNIVTLINNIPYILIRQYFETKLVGISDIINYSLLVDTKDYNNWHYKWCEKIDYYEYQMDQFKKEYKDLYDTFFYFDGMTEMAISLIQTIDLKHVTQHISHYRIGKNTDLNDLYNPLNLIIDTRVRDIAEYFKSIFFYKYNPIREVNDYLNQANLSYEECIMFLARMFYPSYYFDLYDDIISGKESVSKINVVISQINDYELFLVSIYRLLQKQYLMPDIEWLKKVVKLR